MAAVASKTKHTITHVKKRVVAADDFTLLQPIYQQKGKLGQIMRVLQGGEDKIARVIEFERLTTYLTEEAMGELNTVMRLDPSLVAVPTGLFIDKKRILLFMEEKRSLN